MSVDDARKMVKSLVDGMPGMTKFQKKAVKFLKKHGYLVINEQTGHRIYWPEWAEWKAEADTMDQTFWNNYLSYHKDTGDEVCQRVRKHRARGHEWFAKNVLNYPIQGGSAIVLKQAAADLFEWVVRNNYFGKILFCVFVHDEIDCECPKELADTFSKVLETIMKNASGKYYKSIPIPAESSIGDHWIH